MGTHWRAGRTGEDTTSWDADAFGDDTSGTGDAGTAAFTDTGGFIDPGAFGTGEFVPGGFEAGAFSPAFDDRSDGSSEVVLAPLPTRWDAIDDEHPAPASRNGDPAFGDPAFGDAAFSRPDPAFVNPAYSDPAFSGGAYSDSAFSDSAYSEAAFAPDPYEPLGITSGSPSSTGNDLVLAPFGGLELAPSAASMSSGGALVPVAFDAPLAVLPTTLLGELYRICYRLTGVVDLARAMSQVALEASQTPEHPLGEPFVAVATAVAQCLDHPAPDDRRIPYYQHRARLRRDLARRGAQDRAILAVRHLVGMPPSGVAAYLDVPESQVREVASAWCPDDSRVDSLAMLRGIDSWISSDLGSATAGAPDQLAILDELE